MRPDSQTDGNHATGDDCIGNTGNFDTENMKTETENTNNMNNVELDSRDPSTENTNNVNTNKNKESDTNLNNNTVKVDKLIPAKSKPLTQTGTNRGAAPNQTETAIPGPAPQNKITQLLKTECFNSESQELDAANNALEDPTPETSASDPEILEKRERMRSSMMVPHHDKSRRMTQMGPMMARKRAATIHVPPTYRMECRDSEKFSPAVGRKLLQSVVRRVLFNYSYTGGSGATKTVIIADKAMTLAKKFLAPRFPRYKFVVHVTMVELTGEGVSVADRFLWGADTDNYSTYTHFLNPVQNYACVSVLYACYKE